MKLLLKVMFLTMFCAPLTSTAEVWHTSTIRNIYPQADGNFVLQFTLDSESCTNASNPKNYYVSVGQNSMTSDGAWKIYAAAMLAMVRNKTVAIAFDEATATCYVNRLVVTN